MESPKITFEKTERDFQPALVRALYGMLLRAAIIVAQAKKHRLRRFWDWWRGVTRKQDEAATQLQETVKIELELANAMLTG